jgi:DNA-binding protein H-NS
MVAVHTEIEIVARYEDAKANMSPKSLQAITDECMDELSNLVSKLRDSVEESAKTVVEYHEEIVNQDKIIRSLKTDSAKKAEENEWREIEEKTNRASTHHELASLSGRTQTDLMINAAISGFRPETIPNEYFNRSGNLLSGHLISNLGKLPDWVQNRMEDTLRRKTGKKFGLEVLKSWDRVFRDDGNHIAHDPRLLVEFVGGIEVPVAMYCENRSRECTKKSDIVAGLQALLIATD